MNKMMIGVVVAVAVAVVGAALLVQGYTSQPAFASTQSESQVAPETLQVAEEGSATEPEPVEVVIAETNGNETIIESFTMGEMPAANPEPVAQARPQVVASQVVAPRTVTAQQKAAAQANAAQQQAAAQAKKAEEEAAKKAAAAKEQAAAQQAKAAEAAKAQQAAAQAKAQAAATSAATVANAAADAPVAENAFVAFEATFVAPESVSDISAATEQATQNVVEEEEVLSPSAPH